VDVDTLRTLPQREWNSGFAEVIKHGIIRDAEMFRSLANFDRTNLAPLIRRNLEIKSDIVAVDERETSAERALLNFGHTIGHAIENAAGYGELLHGEAVSLGIVAACDVSVRKAGLSPTERDEVVATLERFDLPTHLPGNLPREKIAEALRFDKKFQRGQIKFVVTPSIGSARVTTDVTLADLEQAIARL
jgi:3-dehydroquinate synthase